MCIRDRIKAYDPEIIPYAGMTALNGLKDLIPWIWTFGGTVCLLYTSDAADERSSVDLGGRRIIKKKQYEQVYYVRSHSATKYTITTD